MSQKIKVQDGVIIYSNTNSASTVDFTINGNLNIGTINGAPYPPSSGGGTPGGLSTQLQFNNNGEFGGTPNIIWDPVKPLLVFAAPNETIHDLGTLGSSLNQPLDVSIANNFCCTIGGNIGFTFVGTQSYQPPPLRSMIQSITLYIQQDSTGGRIPSWPAGTYWQDGIIPIASTTPSAIDIYTFLTYNNGTTWIGLQQAKGLQHVV